MMSDRMKVRLLTGRATATEAQDAGSVVALPKAEAIRRIERGEAVPMRRGKPERAVPVTLSEKADP